MAIARLRGTAPPDLHALGHGGCGATRALVSVSVSIICGKANGECKQGNDLVLVCYGHMLCDLVPGLSPRTVGLFAAVSGTSWSIGVAIRAVCTVLVVLVLDAMHGWWKWAGSAIEHCCLCRSSSSAVSWFPWRWKGDRRVALTGTLLVACSHHSRCLASAGWC